MDHFDTERFITEIEVRRGIWDVSSLDYTNKDVKRQLWMEMASLFGVENMTDGEKEELAISLKKKWKNIRDCFQRELRRSKGVKCGSTAKRKSTYTYFNLLQFLLPEMESPPTDTSPQNPPLTPETDNEDGGFISLPQMEPIQPFRPKRKASSDDCDEVPVSVLLNEGIHHPADRRDDLHEFDCDRLFLLSMLDGFRNIPPPAKMRARIEVIKIVEKYQPHRLHVGHYNRSLNTRSRVGSARETDTIRPDFIDSEYSEES